MESTLDTTNQPSSQKGHPKGLWVLFGTEMWERFNFYGMRAILTLFMINSLRMNEGDAALIYGGFLGLCYLTPMLGGFISDRFFGNRNCIMLGGGMMAIGQFLLFASASVFSTNLGLANALMWSALGIIIFGNGFFKPNISSMVGSLYPKHEKSKLDSAFTIFYMGINIGALLSQWLCPMIGDVKVDGQQDIYAFKWGFLAAGIAMVLGTVLFAVLKNRYVVTPDGKPLGGVPSKTELQDADEDGEAQKPKFTTASLIGSLVAFAILFFVFRYFLAGDNFITTIIYPIIYASGLTLAGLIISDKTLTKIERQRIYVIYIISFFVIFFWAAFEQAGSSLTFIASNQTDRHIFGWEMPASMVQIFNGLFVVMLAFPFSSLWRKLNAKGKEPISPAKQAIGLSLIALSYFIIAQNVNGLGDELLAVKWLVLLYFIQTVGELCLSPIGLSLVGKLSPKRFASLLYGVFFLSNAAGYALSGSLGSILPPTGDKYQAAQEVNIDLKAILENEKKATGEELYVLAKLNIAAVNNEKSKENKLDVNKKLKTTAEMHTEKEVAAKKNKPFVNKYQAADTTFTAQEFKTIAENEVITVKYPTFAGFTIKGLFDFFMVFVVLCGIASAILFAITPFLKKMMHGVR